MDTSAPQFDLSLPLYLQQLNKDLVMNIYIDGKWGSYRHLLLGSCATVTVPHACVNIMTPGDLSSLRWLEGYLHPDRYVLVFFIKYWTLICTFIRPVNIEILLKYLIFNLNFFIIELQLIFIFLCSQKLTSPVTAECISHPKSYFTKISFSKYDIYCEHGHP